MNIKDLILALKNAEEPTRDLDAAIGYHFGYRRNKDSDASRYTWTYPSGHVARLPRFTASLEAAYNLAKQEVDIVEVGCAWEEGSASSRINGGMYCQAKTPALALCMAVLLVKMKEDLEHNNSDADTTE